MSELSPPPGQSWVGVDIGGTKMLIVARTAAGWQTWKFATGLDATPATIRERIRGVVEELGPVVIGIGVPGIVNLEGTVEDCDVLPRISGWNPASDLPGVSAVMNDGEAALAAAAAGEAEDATIAVVGTGTGIVAALQVAGRRLRQYRPYAGELGLAPYGPRGTFDDQASGASIVRKLGLEPAEIANRLEIGDPQCRAVVLAAGEVFGAALATVLHVAHPEKIGLYGGALRYSGYTEAALDTLNRLAHPLLRASCRVEVMPEADRVVAIGALRSAIR